MLNKYIILLILLALNGVFSLNIPKLFQFLYHNHILSSSLISTGLSWNEYNSSSVKSRGLVNPSNICYFNSVIQMLYHSEMLRSHILSSTFNDNSVGSYIQKLFHYLSGKYEEYDLINLIKLLNINIHIQEDSEELYLKLIQSINSSSSNNEYKTPFIDLIQGETIQILDCLHVNFTKTRYSKFTDLSIEISNSLNIYDAIQQTFKTEYLIDENQYKAGIHGLQDTKKINLINKIPKVLTIHLKRFSYDINSNSFTKLSNYIDIPIVLNASLLPTNIPQKDLYDLVSIIIHDGTINNGHYTCFARPDIKNNPKFWIQLNDHIVNQVDELEVLNIASGKSSNSLSNQSRNAYMLLYQRRDT